jgi:hypothetical protein
MFGNHRAVEQFDKTKKMVELLGIEDGRLRLEWISAAEGQRFAEVINEFTDQVRSLGPSPLGAQKLTGVAAATPVGAAAASESEAESKDGPNGAEGA